MPAFSSLAVLGRLLRWRIAVAAALAGLAGHIAALAGGSYGATAGYAAPGGDVPLAAGLLATPPVLFFSLFCLAASCSAINQAQEAESDALWLRTASRPLPAGQINKKSAFIMAFILAAIAMAGLAALNIVLALLGLAVVLVYNGIYTPLKKTGWPALTAGAAVGAAPPLFGWLAAGKSLADPFIWALMLVLFAWQFPHVLLRGLRDKNSQSKQMPPLCAPQDHSDNSGSRGGMRPPLPDWSEKRLLKALRLGSVAYALSLALLALSAGGFALPARAGWTILATLSLVPLSDAEAGRYSNIARIDGTLLLAMLLILPEVFHG